MLRELYFKKEENIKESQPMKLEIVIEYISSQIREMRY
jgi:hypothetical protein